jgi:hypothetical protein
MGVVIHDFEVVAPEQEAQPAARSGAPAQKPAPSSTTAIELARVIRRARERARRIYAH